MKVLLVAPYRANHGLGAVRQDIMPSAALIALAAVLREAGHEPVVRDFTTNVVEAMPDPLGYANASVVKIIREENIALVGISFLFGGDFPHAWDLARHIKSECPDVKIATGGIHPTTFPREILTHAREFDYIALGEGERQMVALADRMQSSDLGNLEELAAFAFRAADGTVKVNERRQLLDYDSLPMPAWDLVDFKDYEVDLRNYYNPKGHELRNIVGIFSERGCPFKCAFCDLYMMQGRKVRRRSAEKFVDELAYLANERGQRYFRFMDDNLLVDNRHVISLCKEIVRRRLDIQFDLGGGYVNSYTDDVIDHLVEAGMVSTILNIEHGSEYIRNTVIKKPINAEKIFSVAASLRRYKVQLGTNWIMGFPEDTSDTLQETYDMIAQIKPDRANVGMLIPYPGTPVFDQCLRDNLFLIDIDQENYWRTPFRPHQDKPVILPYRMTVDELTEWRKKFNDIRYKYFGYYYREFKLPSGFVRCADGSVRSRHDAVTSSAA